MIAVNDETSDATPALTPAPIPIATPSKLPTPATIVDHRKEVPWTKPNGGKKPRKVGSERFLNKSWNVSLMCIQPRYADMRREFGIKGKGKCDACKARKNANCPLKKRPANNGHYLVWDFFKPYEFENLDMEGDNKEEAGEGTAADDTIEE